MKGKGEAKLSGRIPGSSAIRFFRKQLVSWSGLTAVAMAFFVYGTWGSLPFPGNFSESSLRSLLRPGSIGQLVIMLIFAISLLLTIESLFALRFILRQKHAGNYLTGFSCESKPCETPFERPGPAREVFFLSCMYGHSYLLAMPLHGDIVSVISREIPVLLPPGRCPVTIYEKLYACHPEVSSWPRCLVSPPADRSKTAPLPADTGGDFVIIEGEISELWFLCQSHFPFAFPHRMQPRRTKKEWPAQLADLNSAVAQAQARAADTGRPVVVARKITTVSMF